MSLSILNIGKMIGECALRCGDRVGLVQGESSWTWSELDRGVDAFAAGLLEMGVSKGDFVFVLTPNNRAAYETIFSTAKIGAVDVPLNFRATPNEVAGFAELCQPKVLVVHEDSLACAEAACAAARSLRHVVIVGDVPLGKAADGWVSHDNVVATHRDAVVSAIEVEHDDVWRVAFSAGSTGKPKALMNSFGQIAYTVVNRLADVMPGTGPDDAFLAIGPLSHGSSTVVIVNAARAARTIMLDTPRFDEAECWDLIERHRVTTLFLVPTMMMRLIKHPSAEGRDVSSLRHVVYAGAPITRADQKRAIEVFGGSLVQYYGSGESLGHGTVLRPEMHSLSDDDPAAPPGTIGLPRAGTDIEIKDSQMRPVAVGEVGELCIRRGPGAFVGYYRDEEATSAALKDNWVVTGDLAKRDQRGFVYIVGRTKEMYKSGGMQVFPNETEDVLTKHDSVEEAYVVPFPDSEWGEVGIAIVRLREGSQIGETELKAHVREHLAGYKQPKRFFFWDDIPKSAVGKVPKHALREEVYRRGLVRPGHDIDGTKAT